MEPRPDVIGHDWSGRSAFLWLGLPGRLSLGLLGGGGSILAVPLLVYVVGVKDTHVAIGTSALAVSANAFANLISHARASTVKWPCAVLFAVAGVAGAAVGAALGPWMASIFCFCSGW